MMGRLLAGAGVALVGGLALPVVAAPPTWVVSSETATVYLVGTIHLLPEDAEWWSKDFATLFGGIDSLHLEIDLTTPPDLMGPMQDYAMGDAPLSTVLGTDDAQALDGLLGRYGQTIASYEAFAPWFAYMQVSSLMAIEAGMSPQLGIDLALATEAVAQGTPVFGIETLESQFAVFAGFPETMQLDMLRQTVAQYDVQVGFLERQVSGWLAGDLGSVAVVNWLTSLAQPEVFETLMVDRNVGFVDAIGELLEGDGTAMVAVGLGHFVGSDAIPTLLEERGHEVVRWQPGA